MWCQWGSSAASCSALVPVSRLSNYISTKKRKHTQVKLTFLSNYISMKKRKHTQVKLLDESQMHYWLIKRCWTDHKFMYAYEWERERECVEGRPGQVVSLLLQWYLVVSVQEQTLNFYFHSLLPSEKSVYFSMPKLHHYYLSNNNIS